MYDKGSGALLIVDVNSYDEHDQHLALNRAGVFLRGKGGFGGERGPRANGPAAVAGPDATVRQISHAANQALSTA